MIFLKADLKNKLKDRITLIREEKAKVYIGKNGISKTILTEIENQFEHNELLKIKFLRNFLTEDFDQDITKLCSDVKAQLVEKRGKTIILYKSKN